MRLGAVLLFLIGLTLLPAAHAQKFRPSTNPGRDYGRSMVVSRFGIVANVMEQFLLSEYGHNSAKALHVMIEAKKLAYAILPVISETPDLRASQSSSSCRKIWRRGARAHRLWNEYSSGS